jgi:hypothetical protein
MILNDKLKRELKEKVVAYFKVIFRYLPEGIEKTHEIMSE